MGISTNLLGQLVAGNTSVAGIAAALDATHRNVIKAAQVLKRRGLIDTHSTAGGIVSGPPLGHYALTDAGREAAASGATIVAGQGERPRKKTVGLRDRAWWHLRAHRVVTLRELLTTHATGTEKAAHINLYKWLAALESVGIIKRLAGRQPVKQSRGRVLWSLEKDLGLKPPVWRQKAGEVFDPNTNTILKPTQKEEVTNG